MTISENTLARLEKFKQSSKYENLSNSTKMRLDNFISKQAPTTPYQPTIAKSTGAIKQLGRGIVEGMPSLEGEARMAGEIRSPGISSLAPLFRAVMPGGFDPEIASRMYEPARKALLARTEIPEPAGFGEYVARQGGRALPTLATLPLAGPVGPVVKGALKGLPILRRAAGTLSSAATMGAYEAGKSVLGGATPEELIQNVKGGATAGALFHQGGKFGATIRPGRTGAVLGGMAAGGIMGAPEDKALEEAAVGGLLMGMGPAKGKDISKTRAKVAARVVNSLVGPKEKELRIGDPGRGISREGLWANSLEKLREKVGERLSDINKMLTNEYAVNSDKKANYNDVLNPIKELLVDLKKRPMTEHNNIITVENILKDILGSSTGKFRRFKGLTPEEARALKQDIHSFKKKESEANLTGMGPSRIEIVLNEVYRNVDRKMDASVPGSKELNQRVTDLIDANEIISRKIRSRQGKPLLTGRNIFSPAAWEEMLPAGVKTGIGALIAPKYNAPSARGSLPLGVKEAKSVGAAAEGFGNKTPLSMPIDKPITLKDTSGQSRSLIPKAGENIYVEPIVQDGKIKHYQVHDGETINVSKSSGEKLLSQYSPTAKGGEIFGTIKAKDIDTEFQELPANSGKQVEDIMKFVEGGGKLPPIVVSKGGSLMNGRHRLEAYKRLGIDDIPVTYAIKGKANADNALKEAGEGWEIGRVGMPEDYYYLEPSKLSPKEGKR